MEQKDKDLLLKDLCSRLPFGLWIDDGYALAIHIDYSDVHFENYFNGILNGDVKPYLRPLSTMTDAEKDEYTKTFDITSPDVDDYDIFQVRMVDWLIEHHFDVRGLIERNLALEATREMYC